MADQYGEGPIEVKVKSQKQLLSEMTEATNKGDWKAVSKISSEIAKLVAGQEKAERDAKLEAVIELTEKVKKTLDKALKPLYDSGELDVCDGVWYSWDFGNTEIATRLLKGTTRKGGNGGGGKKFSITTKELLEAHGTVVIDSGDNAGATYREVYEASTDGNSRYSVRMKLLKLHGLS